MDQRRCLSSSELELDTERELGVTEKVVQGRGKRGRGAQTALCVSAVSYEESDV